MSGFLIAILASLIAASIAAAVVYFWHRVTAGRRAQRSAKKRWADYSKGALVTALPEPVTINAQEANHIVVVSNVIATHRGTIALWADLTEAGVRREHKASHFLFAAGGGRRWGDPERRLGDEFSLSHRPPDPDHPSDYWVFEASSYTGDHSWCECPDDPSKVGWHQLAVTWDVREVDGSEAYMNLYIDGERAAKNEDPDLPARYPVARGNAAMLVGTWQSREPAYYVDARLAWFAVFPEPLPPDRVKQLFRLGPPVPVTALP